MYWVQKGLLFFHLIGLGLYIGFHAVTYLLRARIQAAREAGEEGGAEELANSRMLFKIAFVHGSEKNFIGRATSICGVGKNVVDRQKSAWGYFRSPIVIISMGRDGTVAAIDKHH